LTSGWLAGGMSDFAPCSASSIYVRDFECDLPQAIGSFVLKCGVILPESIGFLAV
jgi:hypothetical protein